MNKKHLFLTLSLFISSYCCMHNIFAMSQQQLALLALDAELLTAAYKGNIKKVETLISKGADVDAQCQDGSTALHLAAEKGQVDFAKLLLKYGADINAVTENDATPLHIAVKRRKLEFVKFLIKNYAYINAQDKDGSTPLHIAVQYRHPEIVKVLMDNDADVNVQNDDGFTPLCIAGLYGQEEIVTLLTKKRKQQQISPESLQSLPKQNQLSPESLQNLPKQNQQQGKIETPLDVAKKHPSATALLYLLQEEICAQQSLDTAFKAKNFNTIKKLLNCKNVPVDINKTIDGNTFLHIAAQDNKSVITKNLIERGANIDAKNENDDTPLHLACKNLAIDTIKILIEHKANPSIKNKDGKTPLALVESMKQNKGTMAIIEFLKANQSVNQTNAVSDTSTSLEATPLSASSVSTNDNITQTTITATSSSSSSATSPSPLKPTSEKISDIVNDAISKHGYTYFNNKQGVDTLLEIVKNKLGLNLHIKKLDQKIIQLIQLTLETSKPKNPSSSSASSSSSSSSATPTNTLSRKYKRHANRLNASNITTPNKNASISTTAKTQVNSENPYAATYCTICLEDFTLQDKIQQLNCGHVFCAAIGCHNYLHGKDAICPMCRTPITTIKNIMYLPAQSNDNATISTEKPNGNVSLKEKEHVDDNQQKTGGQGLSFIFICGHTFDSTDLQGKSLDNKTLCPNCQNKK